MNRMAERPRNSGSLLLHPEGTYNNGLDPLPSHPRQVPRVRFLGHAQTMWANLDKNYDGKSLTPRARSHREA